LTRAKSQHISFLGVLSAVDPPFIGTARSLEAGVFMKVINANSDFTCMLINHEIVPKGSEK
jgi:hypothetical protein